MILMNLKQKMKNFFTLTRKSSGGFTLVELIVVIAILAILGGVAVPAYSGYVKKANMQADRTLVADIMYAAQLASYSTDGFTGSQAVILTTTSDAKLQGADTAWLETALKNAFGENYAGAMKLKYGNWGVGGAMTTTILSHFGTATGSLASIYSGELSPTFANDVDDLFVLMKDISNDIGDGEGSKLVQGAAEITTTTIDPDDFASYWANTEWSSEYFMGENADAYNENISSSTTDSTTLNNAIANAAVIKARNTALANYLKNQYPGDADVAAVCDMIENYTMGNTVVPDDFVGDFLSNAPIDSKPAKYQTIDQAIGELENGEEFFFSVWTYYDNSEGQSLAEIDGLAYYAMMDTVNATATDRALEGASEDEYWDAMSGAVNLYGSIARNEAELADLQTALTNAPEDSIAIIFMSDGSALAISVSPGTALAG